MVARVEGETTYIIDFQLIFSFWHYVMRQDYADGYQQLGESFF